MTLPQRGSTVVQKDAQIQLKELTDLRNSVIGSRTRKGQFVLQGKVPELVTLLSLPLDTLQSFQIRSLAATVIGSLAHAASAPTLLSLLRAGAPAALTNALKDIAAASQRPAQSQDIEQENFKTLEAVLRALRAVLVALAAEVSPNPRYGLGLGRDRHGHSSSMLRPKSSREPAGWDIASAEMACGSSEDGLRKAVGSTNSLIGANDSYDDRSMGPLDDLIFLSRSAIAAIFSPETMPFIVGPMFLSTAPKHDRVEDAYEEGQNVYKLRRAATRNEVAHPTEITSLEHPVAFAARDEASQASSASDTIARGRTLTLIEMVANILTACLNVPGPNPTSSTPVENEGGSSKRRVAEPVHISPEQEISARRGKITDFSAADAPYSFDLLWTANGPLGHRCNEHSQGLLELLLQAVESGFPKAQEAALWALTELTRDNAEISVKLFRCHTPSGLLPTSLLLSLRREASPLIRLAAFSCMTNIVKVHPFTPKTNERVLSVLVELLDQPGNCQIAAAFALAKLVADDADLQARACSDEYDCLRKLGFLLEHAGKALASSDRSGMNAAPRKSAPAAVVAAKAKVVQAQDAAHRLRESVLTALAALAFSRDDMRRQLVDASAPALLPLIVPCLSSNALGTRVAACRLVRALSRSISILRTSLVDAGVAEKLLSILKDPSEDAEVQVQATATICNLVLSFSPMRSYLADNGGIAKLVNLCSSTYGPTRLNALWAIKNLVYASETEFKALVMRQFGYDTLAKLASGTDSSIPLGVAADGMTSHSHSCGDHRAADINAQALQEQALNIIRNLASSREQDIDQTIRGFGGAARFFELIESVIWQRSSDLVLEQAAYILVNVATGNETHRRALLQRANLMDALCFFVAHTRPEIRLAAVWAAMNLTQHHAARKCVVHDVASVNEAHSLSTSQVDTSQPDVTHRANLGLSDELTASQLEPDTNSKETDAEGGHEEDLGQEAVARLRRFGFNVRLRELRFDSDRDVSDRARALLRRFE